ncbi:hypothetical protein BJ508DRAFT_135011 [Ascobolus immersus RN42]|uniref:SAP domain-containing protein n=1 Tax=Ascobolus immersus RN42 TaxID=1160509 RepID=A0A3N4IK51_ASCIM|nr:hypothetical protein BJ508DRAFT_135011 [Ascobolus immersus RN42]
MAAMSQQEYAKLKVTELKELLTQRGLPSNGVKSELVSRLVASDAAAPATGAKKDESLDADGDDYDLSLDDEDHTVPKAAETSAPKPAATETSSPKPTAAATTESSTPKPTATNTTTDTTATTTTTAPASTSAPATTEESKSETTGKKFQFKSIAAQFEEEARQKAEAAEAAKKAAEEAKANAADSTDKPAEEPKPTGPISSKLETLPVDHPKPLTIDEELEKRKKRAERFGLSIEENEAIKKLERAKKFGGPAPDLEKASGEAAEGEPSEKNIVIVKGLDQPLGFERKRRYEGGGRGGEDKRRRGGYRGGRGGRGRARS